MTRQFLAALQFLSRLPVRLRVAPTLVEVGHSILFYPLVGLLLGLLLALLAYAFGNLPVLLAAALVLTAWVMLTGALHLDGLADTVDGWIGGQGDRDRTLAIMKDSCNGAMGVTAIVLTTLLKFAALSTLIGAHDYFAIVCAALLGRAVLLVLFLTTPYVRPGGIGAALAAHMPRKASAAIAVSAYAAVLLVGGIAGLTYVSVSVAVFVYLRSGMRRRIGGTTGDTAGAVVEFTELVVLVSAAVVLSMRAGAI